MKIYEIYYSKCEKYTKTEKPNISYTSCKTLVLATFCDKCDNNNNRSLKEEGSIKPLPFN